MMTKEDYELRLAVAEKILADQVEGSIHEQLAGLAIDALKEQWERAQTAKYVAGLAKDSQRLEWMIRREAQVWKHPNECFYIVSICDENDYYGDTPRDAIDSAMKG